MRYSIWKQIWLEIIFPLELSTVSLKCSQAAENAVTEAIIFNSLHGFDNKEWTKLSIYVMMEAVFQL